MSDYGLTKEQIKQLVESSNNVEIKNMISHIEKQIRRQLAPSERYDVISFMDKFDASVEDIIKAVDYSIVHKGQRSIKYIEGVLYYSKKDPSILEKDRGMDYEYRNKVFSSESSLVSFLNELGIPRENIVNISHRKSNIHLIYIKYRQPEI